MRNQVGVQMSVASMPYTTQAKIIRRRMQRR